MTIKVEFNQHMLFPDVSFETEDLMRAAMLSAETEMKLRCRVWDLQSEVLSIDLKGTTEQVSAGIHEQAFLKGKIAAFMELLDDSKESKLKQSLGN